MSIDRDGSGPIKVGDGVTVGVSAAVGQAASAQDGVFTFDLDLIIANALSPVFQVQSVTRPGADDALLGGGNGTATASGLHAIYGGYVDQTHGVGGPARLFTVNLLAIAPGTTTLTPGPAVDPYGFDFVLYESPSPTVLYGPGLMLEVLPGDVNPVPLPPGVTPGIVVGLLIVASRVVPGRRRVAS